MPATARCQWPVRLHSVSCTTAPPPGRARPDRDERHDLVRDPPTLASPAKLQVAADRTGTLVWREEYEEIFGDPRDLLAALRHRWRQTVQAQLDPQLPELLYDEVRERLVRGHPGVLRILAGQGDLIARDWLGDDRGLVHAS